MALKLSKNEVQESEKCLWWRERTDESGRGEDSAFTPPHLIWLHFIPKPPLTVPATTDGRWGLLPLRKHIPPEQTWRTRCSMLLGCSWQKACMELIAGACIYEQYLTSAGSLGMLTRLQPRPKTFSTEEQSVPRNLSVFGSKPFGFDIGVFNSNNHSLWIFCANALGCS